MLDLQKAFDAVDHSIPCDNLKAVNIGSVKWFQSYLSDTTQIVQVNDAPSNIESIILTFLESAVYSQLKAF